VTANQKRTILVTGGGGFLGGAIVRLLISNGEKVRNLSRSTYAELEALGVEQVQGDLADPEIVQRACSGVETVFHVAAKAGGWVQYKDYYKTNVVGTLNIIKACRAQGVSRLIYTSTPSVIFNGKDMAGVDESVPYPATYEAHYPKTKAMAEKAVLKAAGQGLQAVALRPHLIWGPGDNHLVPRLLVRAHRLRQIGDGKNLVDTIYVDNAAKAHLFADERLRKHPELSGRVYFLSQDDPVPLWRMVNAFLVAGGKPPITKTISPRAAIGIGAVCEAVYRLFNLKGEPPMTRFAARAMSTSQWFNIQAAKTDLGYFPETSISQGLDRVVKWLKTNRV
jgi:nucleoside-diphosphate-sugar epimerase